MSRGGIGVGSASIILVFTVLCLTVFSLITYRIASNDRTLVDAEVKLVTGYYSADTLAEQILAQITAAESIPQSHLGVEIETLSHNNPEAEIVVFSIPVTEAVELLVEAVIYDSAYDIISWQLMHSGEWTADDSLDLWIGP